MSADLREPTPTLSAELPLRRLSEELSELQRESAGRSVTLGELERTLKGRGFALFILLLALPFCLPVSIPGPAIAFGAVIMLMGISMARGRQPTLPGFVLRRELKAETLARLIGFGLRVTKRLEKFAKPRMHFLRSAAGLRLLGVGLASGGIQLLLPIPPVIPLSNTIPAISVVLLIAGMIERDGVLVICGYLVNLAAWIYFGTMAYVLGGGFHYLYERFGL